MYSGHLFVAGILFVNLLIAMLSLQYENTEKEAVSWMIYINSNVL
jgi:hypothetical protein